MQITGSSNKWLTNSKIGFQRKVDTCLYNLYYKDLWYIHTLTIVIKRVLLIAAFALQHIKKKACFNSAYDWLYFSIQWLTRQILDGAQQGASNDLSGTKQFSDKTESLLVVTPLQLRPNCMNRAHGKIDEVYSLSFKA